MFDLERLLRRDRPPSGHVSRGEIPSYVLGVQQRASPSDAAARGSTGSLAFWSRPGIQNCLKQDTRTRGDA